MEISEILNEIATDEFDYHYLIGKLKSYKHPRNKIRKIIQSGKIIRVKKGLYVKTEGNYHHFVLANMIFGPSYISEDSALSYYGLIPEKVVTTTCTTIGRKKEFNTPVGEFHYEPTPKYLYPIGVKRKVVDDKRSYLIASPEKALFDRLHKVKGIEDADYMRDYLFQDMRLDEDGATKIGLVGLDRIRIASKKPFVKTLIQIIREGRNG
jgi:predicted transcriptional regulator of viral defense system